MNPKLFFLIIASVALIIGMFWWFPATRLDITHEQRQALSDLSFQGYISANYSFVSDTDLDGLSDAKEAIYGSDPLRPDTDEDNFADGQEVARGFDPLVPGKDTGALKERKDPTLSVQYFSWLSEKTNDPDPALSAERIEEFLQEKGLLAFALPFVGEYDIKFTNDDPQKIIDYLKFTDSLTLPEEGSPYLAFAGQLMKTKSFSPLVAIQKSVASQLSQIESQQVPPSLQELHRMYAGIWKELKTIFDNLKYVKEDPVLIYLDQKRGEWLAQEVQKTENIRAEAITNLKLLPFAQPTSTPNEAPAN